MQYSIDHVPIHDAAKLMPLMSEIEFVALREDIRVYGVFEKLKFLDGKLLNGRHRLRALAELGIPFEPYIEDLPISTEPYDCAISINDKRRHFSLSQKAMVAAKYMVVLTAANKAKRTKNLKKGPHAPEVSEMTPRGAMKSRTIAAQRLGVSETLVGYAARVLQSEQTELIAQVEEGLISLIEAIALLKPIPPKKPNPRQRSLPKSALTDAPPAPVLAIPTTTRTEPPEPSVQSVYTQLEGLQWEEKQKLLEVLLREVRLQKPPFSIEGLSDMTDAQRVRYVAGYFGRNRAAVYLNRYGFKRKGKHTWKNYSVNKILNQKDPR